MRSFLYPSLVLIYLFFAIDLNAKTDKYRIMWREDPSTTMVIGWNQISGSDVSLYYDTNDHGKDVLSYLYSEVPTTSNQSKGMNNKFVRLTGLVPSTTYYFVIKDEEGCSERMSFATAPDNPYERLSIIAGGDSRNYRKARQKANSLVAKLRPHCVMFGGDMTGGDNAKQWKAWFDDWQQTISDDGRLTPLIITRGNHEYSNKTLTDLFDVASPDAYYALSLGGNLLRVYTLNSLIPSGGNQKKWLEQDLQQSQDYRWRIAQYHYAIRPHTAKKSERNNQLRDWSRLFEKYNVKMAVESDAHCVKWTYPIRPSREKGSDEGFIRDDELGTVYIGEGCWGAPLRRNNDDKDWTRDSGSFNQFKWIFMDQDRIEVRTVKTDFADQVASVDPNYVFSEPTGLELWNPSNGSVVTIENFSIPKTYDHLAAKGTSASSMSILDFGVAQKNEGVLINWKTEGEGDVAKTFEIQKSENGIDFETVAKINSKGLGNNGYDFFDLFAVETSATISYRLKENFPNGRFQVYGKKEVALTNAPTEKVNKLIPISSGLVQAKYVLDNPADIDIQLVDQKKTVLSRSDYKNQHSGNYMQSIDMSDFPEGQYMLTIKANQAVIQKYLVVKLP